MAKKNKQRTISNKMNGSELPSKDGNGRFTNLSADKLRGGYYTSPAVAKWMCEWAIQSPQDRILEPSCGDGVFLESAADRLLELDKRKCAKKTICGIEIVKDEANKARSKLSKIFHTSSNGFVTNADFFDLWPQLLDNKFDCVLGNPPFIRYQSCPEPSRSKAMAIMEQLGLRPNRLTNLWVPFIAASIECLKSGGRLAFVVPAELLQVSYASQLRLLLVDRFKRVDIVACNDLFFERAEQEVLLLLAEGLLSEHKKGSACRVTLTEMGTVDEIVSQKPERLLKKASPKSVRHDSEKWLKYFLSGREITFMRRLRNDQACAALSLHAKVNVGVVTGKNSFFVLSHTQIKEYGVQEYTIPLIGRSSQLRGARLSRKDWTTLAEEDRPVHLFYVEPKVNSSLCKRAREYVRCGERQDIHKGYKCSIRDPWYSVPSVWTPDCFCFRQIYDFPRIVLNKAQATSTDTIHRMKCKSQPELIVTNMYTHLTAASAEIEGRSYGGGVLELEPTEAGRLLMPSVLQKGLPVKECDRLIRNGRLQDLLDENDKLILMNAIGLTERECRMLRRIWEKMRDRRMSRRRNGRK